MQVTRYQMHNVLECYSKKLSRARGTDRISGGRSKNPAENLTFPSDPSRGAAMDKISRQVFDKVMDVVALSSTGRSSRCSAQAGDAGADPGEEAASMEFPIRAMEPIDRRCAARLSLDGPGEKGGSHV
jgi:hypothetical protein